MKNKPKNNTPLPTIADIETRLGELEETKAPVLKRFKINDATVEKTHELLSTNLRGLLTVRDELIGLWSYLDEETHQADKAFTFKPGMGMVV